MINVEDPRLDGDNLCRERKFIGGKEFICIRESHASKFKQTFRAFEEMSVSESDKHYFVRRYPYGTH